MKAKGRGSTSRAAKKTKSRKALEDSTTHKAAQAWEKKALTITSVILVVIITFIIGFLVVFVNKDFYDQSFANYGAYQELGVDGPREIVDYLIKYLTSENTETEASPLELFTEKEREHLGDVQKRIVFIKYFGMASVILIIISVLRISGFNNSGRMIRKIFIYAAATTFSICLIIFLLSLNFSSFFESFHKILFPAGNYVFPGDSLLITLFPERFFIDFARKMLVESMIISLMILLAGAIPTLRFNKKKE